MLQRLSNVDRIELAGVMQDLANLHRLQGRYAEAEREALDALAMQNRLRKEDHPELAFSRSVLGIIYLVQGKFSEAELHLRAALDMRKRLYKGLHPDVCRSLDNLAMLYILQGKYAEAEEALQEALALHKKMFKGDNHDLLITQVKLARVLTDRGNYPDAEKMYISALDMRNRLFAGDHPDTSNFLESLASIYQRQEKYLEADPLYRKAIAMDRRLIESYARLKSEADVLNLISSRGQTNAPFLSNALKFELNQETIYAELWASKGIVSRIYEQRQQAARAAALDPKIAKLLADLTDARHRRAELIFAPDVKDPDTRKKREEDIKAYDQKIADLDRAIRPLLPAIDRAEKLAKATPADLQKAMPPDAAVVDFLRFNFFEQDKAKPGKAGEKWTPRYLAFIITKDKIDWINLDAAADIEGAIAAWRAAITSGKDIPATIPAKVRELVWDKVRKQIPAHVKTLYISPDAALCRLPWAALPGDKPGTILLDDFAVATIPHATFLLDQLWPREPSLPRPANGGENPSLARPANGALVVGGVRYDAEISPALPPNALVSRGEPLLKPGAKVGWSFLPATLPEAVGVSSMAGDKKLPVSVLKDDGASVSAVLAALPKARYAHLATHGFFADPSFRSAFQLDEKDYEMSLRGERIGRAALSPLVMTGLVFAGANNPKTPGRGIITGESLIDLDLSGLELAVLSACETGLGDVAGGEGSFGLQRAFHMAGTRNVVASLWKVPDQPTAALMALFYCNLWEKNLSPMESLRQAQLEIYHHPDKIADLAANFRGKFKVVPGTTDAEPIKPSADGKAHPQLWAAFLLSGPGR